MARQRLDTAKREHETARGVAPIGAKRHGARDIESRNDLAAGAETNLVAQVKSGERVVHQQQRLLQRRADVTGEFHRRGAGAALAAVDHDEIRPDASLEHRLADAEELPGVAEREFKANRLA